MTTPFTVLPAWMLLTYALPTTPFTTLTGCVTVVLLAVCSYTDLRWGKIRNSATYTALLWAIAIGLVDTLFFRPVDDLTATSRQPLLAPFGVPGSRVSAALGSVGLGDCLAGAGVAFAVMLLIYRLAGGGAGDVKLATVLGALLGPSAAIDAILWTYVLAGVAILVWVIMALGPLKLFHWVTRKVGSRLAPTRVAPPSAEDFRLLRGKILLGPFFAMGTIAVLSGTNTYLVGVVAGG